MVSPSPRRRDLSLCVDELTFELAGQIIRLSGGGAA